MTLSPNPPYIIWYARACLPWSGREPSITSLVITLIGAQLEGYEGPVLGAKERLSDALAVMLLNIAAATLMQQADAIYEQMCPMR